MPIYAKNLKKPSFPEPKGRWPWNLVCSIGCTSTANFVQIISSSWPWPILRQDQIWSLLNAFVWEKGKIMDFFRNYYSVWCQKFVDAVNWMSTWTWIYIYEYQRSMSLIDLGPRSLRFSIFKLFFIETVRPIEVKCQVGPPWDGERKFVQMVQVTWPLWLPCPYMVKTLKIFSRTKRPMTLKVCMQHRVLPSLFEWWPLVDHDLFYGKVKFGPLCF